MRHLLIKECTNICKVCGLILVLYIDVLVRHLVTNFQYERSKYYCSRKTNEKRCTHHEKSVKLSLSGLMKFLFIAFSLGQTTERPLNWYQRITLHKCSLIG